MRIVDGEVRSGDVVSNRVLRNESAVSSGIILAVVNEEWTSRTTQIFWSWRRKTSAKKVVLGAAALRDSDCSNISFGMAFKEFHNSHPPTTFQITSSLLIPKKYRWNNRFNWFIEACLKWRCIDVIIPGSRSYGTTIKVRCGNPGICLRTMIRPQDIVDRDASYNGRCGRLHKRTHLTTFIVALYRMTGRVITRLIKLSRNVRNVYVILTQCGEKRGYPCRSGELALTESPECLNTRFRIC